jgi:hypothetical protein
MISNFSCKQTTLLMNNSGSTQSKLVLGANLKPNIQAGSLKSKAQTTTFSSKKESQTLWHV